MTIADAVAGLGQGALTEERLREHVFPQFQRTLARPGIYLANHSLGRPLDRTEDDLREGFALWQRSLGDAWEPWLAEEQAHRTRLARLMGAGRADCVVPKVSAGQGLRTVLNAMAGTPRVVTSTAEFDSVDVILKQYAAAGRIRVTWVDMAAGGGVDTTRLVEAAARGADLVVVSQVLFMTGEVVGELDRLAARIHQAGAQLLVDAYHAVGVFPVDVAAMGADFVIGGSYKYLRGGPGAAFLYVSPAALESGLTPLDIGWFAKQEPFRYARPDPPRFAAGGDALLESTPPVMTYYQARAGQELTLALGVERIRAYCLERLGRLRGYLAEAGVAAAGGDAGHGAFLTIEDADATGLAARLEARGVSADARGRWLRLCPDVLTTDAEMRAAARMVGELRGAVR